MYDSELLDGTTKDVTFDRVTSTVTKPYADKVASVLANLRSNARLANEGIRQYIEIREKNNIILMDKMNDVCYDLLEYWKMYGGGVVNEAIAKYMD